MKKFLALMLALVMCLSLVACGGGNDAADTGEEAKDDYKLVLKMSHVFAPTEALTLTMDEICKNVTEKTGGAIEIQHFPQSQLPVYKDGLEQVVQGAHFISVEDPSYVGDYVPDFNVLAGPMLVTSYDQYVYLTKSAEVQDMLARAAEKGIHVINIDYIFGFRSMMTNKLIETPEDMKGLKLRVAGCKVLNTAYDLWGANWTNANWSEVYTGLQTGTYEGQENPFPTADGASMSEVQTHVTNWTGIYDCIFFTMNKELFDSLPADLQKTVLECGAKAAENQRKLQREGVNEVIEKWKAAGVTVTELSDEAVAEFKAATASMYTDPEIVELLTADLIAAFTK